jgi:uncharacterized membrane protein YqiK
VVLPVLQETIPVNMNTLRLEVYRANEQALITKDRMRVDVQAEFYVRVKPTEESIAHAAQTLGMRTMKPEALRQQVEGKFVDALRAVAADMEMEELHEQRVQFVQKVQQAVSEDLLKNGLELESVSLTGLDQTSQQHFNPQNAFDAQGLTKLTEQIEARRKQRNDIEQNTEVSIKTKNLEAEKQKFQISRDEEYARLEQEREIAIRRATQKSEVASQESQKLREAKEAEIIAKRQVDMAEITSKQAVEEERIKMEQQIREKEIIKSRAIEISEIEKHKSLELAEQDRAIAVAEKSRAQSEAQAQADKARADAVKAEEGVITVREIEKADRQKQIELVQAAKEAEREAIGIKVAAEADRKASEDKASAIKTLAEAEADKNIIIAQGEANSEKLRADAMEKKYAVDAVGRRSLHEADNLLSPEQITMRIKMALIEKMPSIIEESVKPIEKIDGIKIVHVEGLGTNGSNGKDAPAASSNLADQVINSALRYRSQAPLLDSLLKEVGIVGSDINALTSALKPYEPETQETQKEQEPKRT